MPKSKRKRRSNSKSGFFGVTKNMCGDKYTVVIRINGKNKYLGYSFDTAKQAAKAYDNEAIKLRNRFSTSNSFQIENLFSILLHFRGCCHKDVN